MTDKKKGSKSLGLEAAALAGDVQGGLDETYEDPLSAHWPGLMKSTATFIDDDMADCVIENISYAKSFGLKPKFFPRFFNQLNEIRTTQAQRRAKYAKGDMSSYGWLKGKDKKLGEPVWELSVKWGTLYYDHGGSALIEGGRRMGKTLYGTQSISLPWINTFRHVVSGVYADEINSEVLTGPMGASDNPYHFYHYQSSMNKQLQTALRIKIESLERQAAEGVKHPVHPLIVDLIDEAAISKGKYRTSSDKVMQQMYIAAIAGHIGIFVVEIHPFDTAVIWVRESVTHRFKFTERGRMTATVFKPGQAKPNIKRIWGFKSLEKRIDDGDEYIKYRPYAPESFSVDVDVIAMLDFVNEQMELRAEKGKEMSEIEQWRNVVRWLETDKEANLSGAFGISYGKMVSAIAIFMVQIERYNVLMKGHDKYKPVRIAQQLVEQMMADSPWPVNRNTLGEDIVKARHILKAIDLKKNIRAEVEKDIIGKLRSQGVKIDDEGNLID
jgi:hypothetical protein